MTPTNFFFTNERLSLVYLAFGFTLLFGTALFVHVKELIWMGMGASVFFFVLSLFFIMKEYAKDEQIKQV